MGAWGPAIFSNDTAEELKTEYLGKLAMGVSDEDAEKAIISEFQNPGVDDGGFWIGFAVLQWKIGRLSSLVKENALAAIAYERAHLDLLWKKDFREKRREHLSKAARDLTAPMKPRKKIPMPKWATISPWKKGTVFSAEINHPYPKYERFLGAYVLFQIVDVIKKPPEEVPLDICIVKLLNWIGHEQPNEESLIGIQSTSFVRKGIVKGKPLITKFDEMSVRLDIQMIRSSGLTLISETPVVANDYKWSTRLQFSEDLLGSIYEAFPDFI